MSFVKPTVRRFLDALSELAYCNPFQPRRIELEQAALGDEFQPEEHIAWSRSAAAPDADRPNVARLTERADQLAERLRAALAKGQSPTDNEARQYEDLVAYVLYYRGFATITPAGLAGHKSSVAALWRTFRKDYEHFLAPLEGTTDEQAAAHLFACLYQLRRAFRHIFDCILGDSLPAAQLRGQVWQSIFTHDMRRYRRCLYDRMADLATLITGPSGTGKELVARAVALSQFVAFDPSEEQFVGKPEEGFIPINLSALSPTLIESELFGHCRGAFTGAGADRMGWLESCPPHGAVFLDEIGELDPAIQVKLLRVVQSRVYCRLGETSERQFMGKIIVATNRDLAEEIDAGRFRQDFYYRLCSDHIQTPPLRAHLADRPGAITELIRLIAERVAGADCKELAQEVEAWIAERLGDDYPWPGNIRELEQCVRNILVRREYWPQAAKTASDGGAPVWLAGVERGELTADDLVSRYCTAVYARLGSYEQTAQTLGLDRRTVRKKVDETLLARLKDSAAAAHGAQFAH